MKIKAMIHSLGKLDEVEIFKNGGQLIAKYAGKKYTAIFNCFTGLYYVDDKFGEIRE